MSRLRVTSATLPRRLARLRASGASSSAGTGFCPRTQRVLVSSWPRLPDEGPDVAAACPGLRDTPLLHTMFPEAQGQPVSLAAGNVLSAVLSEVSHTTYLHAGRPGRPSQDATGPGVQE